MPYMGALSLIVRGPSSCPINTRPAHPGQAWSGGGREWSLCSFGDTCPLPSPHRLQQDVGQPHLLADYSSGPGDSPRLPTHLSALLPYSR